MNEENEIVRQYGQSVFAIIFRMVGNQQDAEELTQDALLQGIRQRKSHDPQQSSLRTWFCSIAYHTALNHLRRPAIQTLPFEEEHISTQAEAEMQALFQQPDDYRTELLERAIGLLSPEERTLIMLFYYNELSLADIGFITGQQPGAIATRLHRIRKRLYHLIKRMQTL